MKIVKPAGTTRTKRRAVSDVHRSGRTAGRQAVRPAASAGSVPPAAAWPALCGWPSWSSSCHCCVKNSAGGSAAVLPALPPLWPANVTRPSSAGLPTSPPSCAASNARNRRKARKAPLTGICHLLHPGVRPTILPQSRRRPNPPRGPSLCRIKHLPMV